MLTPAYIWISLSVIFILFVISSVVLIVNARDKSTKHTVYSKHTPSKTNFWKVVKGQITQATIDYRNHKTLFNSTIKQYRTRITYEYFAYDQTYSQTISINDWTEDKNLAKKYLAKHPTGGAIVVRFHPQTPEKSIVELNR